MAGVPCANLMNHVGSLDPQKINQAVADYKKFCEDNHVSITDIYKNIPGILIKDITLLRCAKMAEAVRFYIFIFRRQYREDSEMSSTLSSQTILLRKCGEKGGTYALVYTVQ